MKPTSGRRSVVELRVLVPWALERLAKGEFRLRRRRDGEPTNLVLDKAVGTRSVERIAAALRNVLSSEEPAAAEALWGLREARNPEKVRRAMQILFPGPIGDSAGRELADSDWETIVSFVYQRNVALLESAKRVIEKRLSFGTEGEAWFEDLCQSTNAAILPAQIQRFYTLELGRLFPGIVKRAEKLRLLRPVEAVLEYVRRYLLEASGCYAFGQFLAALLLCRSALEEAVEDRLKRHGHGAELAKIDRKEGWLYALLKLAHKKGILNDKTYEYSDGIRHLANKAIHGETVPGDDTCKQAYKRSRSVLESLYRTA
jgi:hypothetical protein